MIELLRAHRRHLSVGLLVLFGAWATWYVWHHVDDFRVLADLSFADVSLLYLLTIATILCNGLFAQRVLLAFDITLGAREWISLSVVTTAFNYITPLRGGAGVRAVYLKARYRHSFAEFASTLAGMYLLYLSVHGLLGLVALAAMPGGIAGAGAIVPATFSCAAFGSAALVLWNWQPTDAVQRVPTPLRRVLAGWSRIRCRPRLLLELTVLTVVYALVNVMRSQMGFAAIGVELTWPAATVYTASQALAALASITPGSIGVVDAVAIYMGAALDYSTAAALSQQMLLRVILWSLLLTITPFALHHLGSGWRSEPPAEPAG